MGACVLWFLVWVSVEGDFEGDGFVDGRFRGIDVLLLQAHVAFACGHGLEEVLCDECSCEAWPCGEVSFLDGVKEGGRERAEGSAMVKAC